MQAQLIVNELNKLGVTHAVGLPDNTTAALFEALREEPSLQLVSVTREGEAFALAAGLWVGGANPVVVIQNTGFFESGDAIRGCATRMRIPLVCLVGYRGYQKLALVGGRPSLDLLTPDNLSRPEVDSCALLFEPTLRAWGIPYERLVTDADVAKIAEAFHRARQLESPVALLISEDTT